jgi:hypothetical protein
MNEISKRKIALREEYKALKDSAQELTGGYVSGASVRAVEHNAQMDEINSKVDLLVEEYKMLNLVQFCQTGKFSIE